jgi:hypothetical protein
VPARFDRLQVFLVRLYKANCFIHALEGSLQHNGGKMSNASIADPDQRQLLIVAE